VRAPREYSYMHQVATKFLLLATIHTSHGCTINASYHNFTGTLTGVTNCAADETNDSGCGITLSQSDTFGAAFNQIGGGVYASKIKFAQISLRLTVYD
jgi:hypothetical protein